MITALIIVALWLVLLMGGAFLLSWLLRRLDRQRAEANRTRRPLP